MTETNPSTAGKALSSIYYALTRWLLVDESKRTESKHLRDESTLLRDESERLLDESYRLYAEEGERPEGGLFTVAPCGPPKRYAT